MQAKSGNGAGPLARHWLLDESIAYLNHGSLGACPRAVLEVQQGLRDRLEREPISFLDREGETRYDQARRALAAFVGTTPETLVFVPNATAGVNTVLRSLPLAAGDEILLTDHSYKACANAAAYVASRHGARVVTAPIPFPVRSEEEVVAAVLAHVTPRTRLALLDHITSPTALLLPIAPLVAALNERGVDTLVDGAHAPGQVPLNLDAIGAAYYTGNCHKWLCTPKGSAFLQVRPDRQAAIHPLSISHGYTAAAADRPRWWLEFDWTGTSDPTPYLCIPPALDFLGGLVPGGWSALMDRNHALALRGRDILCDALGIEPPVPDAMLGAMAAVPLPARRGGKPADYRSFDPLQVALFRDHGIEVPISPWPRPESRLLRISAQLYNAAEQYEALASTLARLLADAH